jgi:hypothetical protein
LKAFQENQKLKILKVGIVSTALFGLVLSARSIEKRLAIPNA